MSKACVARTALLALLTLAASAAAWGSEQERTRVTIRGTGSDVAIERTQTEVRKRSFEKSAVPAGPMDEAVRLKASGADDYTVIDYLRRHESEIPPIVEAEDVSRLRRAGAGKSVVAYLATVAAVDIGATGEGYQTVVSNEPAYGPGEAFANGAPYDYPIGGGYATPYPQRFGPRSLVSSRRFMLHLGHPVFRMAPRASPPRAVPIRRRMVE
jgi:hypothetical protein